jgi:lipopolysaccharide/colanic/teichoic acid biosynthesis glycosyltransferase
MGCLLLLWEGPGGVPWLRCEAFGLGGRCPPSQLKRLLQGGRGVEPDLAYINSLSLWLDIKNLIKPPFTLLPKDIY